MTFAQLEETSLCLVLHEGTHAQISYVVFDIYLETSIKDAEKCKQRLSTYIQFKTLHHATTFIDGGNSRVVLALRRLIIFLEE